MKIKVEAIVLGSFPFGESHKIITLFSKNRGILKAVAHGVRKPTSKFGSSMELFNKIEAVLYLSKKSDLHTIRECTVTKSRHKVREIEKLTGMLFYLSEFIVEFFKNAPPNIQTFDILDTFIDFINSDNSYVVFRSIILRLLLLQGFIGEIGTCSECNKSDDKLYISGREGFFYCSKCKNEHTDNSITTGVLFIIKKLAKENINKILRLKISKSQKMELEKIHNTIIHSILGHSLKSESFLSLTLQQF